MYLIVLRGPAGAGKSTLALAVQQDLGYPTAHLDTDVLNWQFVPGEPNKYVVFNVLQQITSTYLAHSYHVIIAGTIPTGEEAGALAAIKAAATFHQHIYTEFFCDAPLETCVARAAGRDRDVSSADVERWWLQSRDDLAALTPEVTVLDMTDPLQQNVRTVCTVASA